MLELSGCGPPPANCVADDWGMSPGINQGILELCEAGIVQGVSLLANLDNVKYGLDSLLKLTHLKFSLHLNFTYGRPLSSRDEIPTLCHERGSFQTLRTFLFKVLCGRISTSELIFEAERQIHRLKTLGVPLMRVAGHHHVHMLPRVCGALTDLFKREGIEWARVPIDLSHVPSFLLGQWYVRQNRFTEPYSLRLEPSLYLRPDDLDSPMKFAEKMRNEDGLQIIVHPAKFNDLRDMAFFDSYQDRRIVEFQILRDWPDRGWR